MSLEVFGDEGIGGNEGYVTEERAQEMFVAGLQAMREMLARHLEKCYMEEVANTIRRQWAPTWGVDPGQPSEIVEDCWLV